MATRKRGTKKPDKARTSPAARKPPPAVKKTARQPAPPRLRAEARTSEPAAAKASREPALLVATTNGLGALRAAIDTDARKRGAPAAKRDKSLADALDRLGADFARLLR